ncbi:MAG TPA: NYN domain-containing protein [Candidatus Saccharimonadales bacterium]|nr:NYN domain-containing protein [Candidatus Saccharimonadales bacterium]
MEKTGGVYAYIDGANLHKGIEELGWQLDYARFRIFLRDKYHVSLAYIFLGYVPELTALYRNLQKQGYTIIFKPTLKNDREEIKGNCDAELVLQAMIDFETYSRAVIVTGDGDFACLVSHLQNKQKLSAVISPNPKKCSVLLRRLVPNDHLFLDRFRERLEYKRSK